MKTMTIPLQATSQQKSVKKLLTYVINFVISEKFSIFVMSVAAVLAWVGALAESPRILVTGCLAFILGFGPRSLAITVADIKQDVKINHK